MSDTDTIDIEFEDDWHDGSGIRKMRRFFKNFCFEFAKFSMGYQNKLGEFPFIYNERSLVSVVLPSLIKADGDNTFVFMEQPFKKLDNTQRFLDFYVDHGDNIYLIEMKHRWNAYRTDDFNTNTLRRWNECLLQINDLDKETIKNHICDPDFYSTGLFKTSLLVLPVYQNQRNEFVFGEKNLYDNCADYLKLIKGSFPDRFEGTRIKKPNFFAVWKIPEDNRYSREHKDGFEFYPYVIFAIYQERIS